MPVEETAKLFDKVKFRYVANVLQSFVPKVLGSNWHSELDLEVDDDKRQDRMDLIASITWLHRCERALTSE